MVKSPRRRLDVELVRRGLAPSRSRAQELIAGDLVTVEGAIAAKAGRLVTAAESIGLLAPSPRFVGRGGEKLAGALERLGLDVAGRRALDAGASTGGFTDCLLQHGAAEVVAVDVGRNQLHHDLRVDDRVRVHERTDVRDLDLTVTDGPVDLVVADLSFISLRLVVEALATVSAQGADWLLLVKPQFEAGRAEADAGRGIITDPEVWRRVLVEATTAIEAAGAGIMGVVPSTIRGSKGNVEFIAHGVVGRPGIEVEGPIDAAIAEVAR